MRTLLFFALFYIGNVFAQTEGVYVPYRKGDLWGYSDANGKIIIEPVYDKVGERHIEGQFKVYKNGKVGIADRSGAVIFTPQFDSIFPRYYNPRGHMLFVQKDGLWGLYTHEGKEMVPIKYDELDKTHSHHNNATDGKIFVAKKGNEYFVISNEDKVLEGGLQSVKEMSNDGVKLKRGNKFALFSLDESKAVTAFEFDSIAMLDVGWNYKSDKIFYGAIGEKNYAISIDGKKVELEKRPDLRESGLAVEEGFNKYFPHKERMILPEQVMPGEYSPLKTNGKYNYRTSAIDGWKYGNAIKAEKKKLIGLEGKRGEYFIPPIYSKLILFEYNDPVVVYEGKKAGLYNCETNIMMIPPAYDAIHNVGLYVLERKGKVGIFDERGMGRPVGAADTFLIEPAYDEYIERIELLSDSYRDFYVYKFLDKGKVCYVGMNGVKLFEAP